MYECSECDKAFANKSNYNRHLAKSHPEETDGEEEDYTDRKSMSSKEEVESDESMDSDEDDEEIDIREQMYYECDEESGISITDVYKDKILFLRAMKKDSIHKAVMQTLQRVRDEEDMDFAEALDYAIEKRRFLIYRQANVYGEKMKQ